MEFEINAHREYDLQKGPPKCSDLDKQDSD